MSSRALNETPWDKKEDRERDLDVEVGRGVFIEYPSISLSAVHPLSLKYHSTVGSIVCPFQKACLQLVS